MGEAPSNVHETSALPDDIREALAVTNIKVIAENPCLLQNLASANAIVNQQLISTNAISHQQTMDQIREAVIGRLLESILATSPSEGGFDLAGLAQLLKGLQLTPPASE